MRQTELSLNRRDRRIVDEFRSKGLHMARELNRAGIGIRPDLAHIYTIAVTKRRRAINIGADKVSLH